ncbi:hypothetical protein RQN46_00975 [Arcanobacterium hippocoleae]
MPTLLGYTAAWEMIHADESVQPMIIGTRSNRLMRLPMMETIANTRAVKKYIKEKTGMQQSPRAAPVTAK